MSKLENALWQTGQERGKMYQRANGTWCDTIPQGKGKPHKSFYGKTKAEVKQKIAAWKEEREKGVTVSEALDVWQASREGQVTPETLICYKRSVRRLKAAFGDTYLKELQASDVQALLNDMAAQRFSRTTVNMALMVMSMTFNHFIVQPDSTVRFNPCTACRVPTALKRGHRELPQREAIEKVKNGVDAPFGLFAFFLLYTGCRRGEALALTDKDITEDSVNVNKTLVWLSGESLIKPPKTPSANREIVLLPPLKAVLPKFEGYLFSDDGGKTPLTQSKFQMLWQEYCVSVGLAHSRGLARQKNGKTKTTYTYDICPHQLRHEFATMCYDAELDAKDAADLLGHASEKTTREIYTHIQNNRRKASAEKLTQFVAKSY